MRRFLALVTSMFVVAMTFIPIDVADAPPVAAQAVGPDFSLISNTPVRGGWGVSGLEPVRTVNFETLVWDFAQIGDRMYVAGAFLNVQQSRNGQQFRQPYLAAFDIRSGAWISEFAPVLSGPVYALAVSPRGTLIAGGEFSNAFGQPNTSGLVSLNPTTGAIDTQFQASVQRPNSTEKPVVRDLLVNGDQLYIGGNFSHVRGKSDTQRTRVYKVARINAKWGTPDGTWKPTVTGAGVWGLTLDAGRGRITLAGLFDAVAATPGTNGFATVNTTNGALVPNLTAIQWNSTGQRDAFDVGFAADKIWTAGSEHIVHILDGGTRQVLGWHTTGFVSRNNYSWQQLTTFIGGGDYQVVETFGNYVLTGCHCTYENNNGFDSHYSSPDGRRFRTLLAEAYDASTGRLVSSFVPDLAGSIEGIWAIKGDTLGCIWLGGQFDVGGLKTGASFWVGNFARFCPPGVAGPDTESPTVPAGLTATAVGADVTLAWQAATDNRGVTSYVIERDGVDLTTITNLADLTFRDVAPPVGFRTYRVRALDAAGNRSAWSPGVSVEAGPDTTPPSVPVNLQATVAGTTVTVTWDPATDNRAVDQYLVFRNGPYRGWTRATTFTDTVPGPGTYRYEIRTVDTSGNRSPRSVALVVVVP